MTAFGSQRKDGDFTLVGDIQNESCNITLSACFYREIEDGKAISIYGYCTDSTELEIKIKGENGYETFDPENQLIRFDVLKETITKEYNGNKNKKEPSAVSKFIYPIITEKFKPDEIFSVFIDFRESEQVINTILTGKSDKGKEVPKDLLDEWKDGIITFNELKDDEKAKLEGKKPSDKSSYGRRGGGGYPPVKPQDKHGFVCELLGLNKDDDGKEIDTSTLNAGDIASHLKELKEADSDIYNEIKWYLAVVCQ